MMRVLATCAGWACLVVPSFALLYLTMPAPGSQGLDSMRVAWWLERAIWPLRILGGIWLGAGVGLALRRKRSGLRMVGAAALVLSAIALPLVFQRGMGSAMFAAPEKVEFRHGVSEALPASTVVLGVRTPTTTKAYPIRLLAYHHVVHDTIDDVPVIATYCTMCRSGRIFDARVDGTALHFEVVGANHFNAILRDVDTGSWWVQATGSAEVGPLEGSELTEVSAMQMTLGQWLEVYPDSQIMQPDPASADGYTMFSFDKFDRAVADRSKRAGAQWVIRVPVGPEVVGYRWTQVAKLPVHHDRVGEVPIAVFVHPDGQSFAVFDTRTPEGAALRLEYMADRNRLRDTRTGSEFDLGGKARGGPLAGVQLAVIPAAQEFRHAFEQFTPDAELRAIPDQP